jgi:hypothetical protein
LPTLHGGAKIEAKEAKTMAIYLDHTIVPAHEKESSARFFAKIFGLEYKGPWGHFAPVKVNETLSMDFDNRETVESHHYAFIVSDEEFDTIFERVKAATSTSTTRTAIGSK